MCAKPAPAVNPCRQRLIEAASEAFLAEGYGASVDRIAARAGVAKQTLYNHFGSKEELYRAVGANLADAAAIQLGCVESADLRSVLTRFALDLRQRNLSDEGIGMFRAFYTEVVRFPEVAHMVGAQCIEQLRDHVAAVLATAMRKGELREEDPALAASLLLAMVIDVDRPARLMGHTAFNEVEEAARVEKIIGYFLRAFQPPVVSGA